MRHAEQGRTYERVVTLGGALLVSVNGRRCYAVGSSRGDELVRVACDARRSFRRKNE